MNLTKSSFLSPLEAERQRLLDRLSEIQHSGHVAPAYTFLSETTTTTKTGKTYRYARLVHQQQAGAKQKTQSLGRVGSTDHHVWKRAIARREAIAELEMQLSLLNALIERQWLNESIVERDFTEPTTRNARSFKELP